MQIQQRTVVESSQVALEREGVTPWIARLYAARGVGGARDIQPGLDALPGTSTMKGLVELAVEVYQLRAAGKRILVVGDYDCDGATASAILARGLQLCGVDAQFLVPRRLEHGYGLTVEVVRQALAFKPSAIITVDCGISSFEGIEEARRHGVPVFVTDHHLPGDSLPEAALIVNPNQPGCGFPTRSLCGAGVALYLIRALREQLVMRDHVALASLPSIQSLLGWAAIGTVADVVPLDGVNRAIVGAGLKVLRAGRGGPGVHALVKVAGRNEGLLSTQDIAFALGPRINAAGRMATMDAGVNLLLDGGASAMRTAHELNALNVTRRAVEAEMSDDARAQIDGMAACAERRTIVAAHQGWHEGVIGIVAGRLKEQHWRPTVVLAGMENGQFKGSGRSIPGFHLRDALALVDQRNPGLLIKYGGHAAAAGLTLREGGVERFTAAFEEVAGEMLAEEDLRQVQLTDGPLPPEALSLEGARALNEGLWGQGFPAPVFHDDMEVREMRQLCSRETGEPKHLKLKVAVRGVVMGAVWFNQVEPPPSDEKRLYSLTLNSFRGEVSPQLIIQG